MRDLLGGGERVVAAVFPLGRCAAPEAERQNLMALICREVAIRMIESADEARRRAAFQAISR